MRSWWMVMLVFACGDDGEVYAACEEPADCEVPEDATAECLDKSSAGFCTWACDEDAECTFDGDDEWPRLCASFESESGKHCFPACQEPSDEDDDGCPDGTECRSTGGGSENRKVCFPTDPGASAG